MTLTGTLTTLALVGACLAGPAATATTASAAAGAVGALGAVAVGGAATSSTSLAVTLPDVAATALVVGDVLTLHVGVDSRDATVLRFQTRPDTASAWTDALVQAAPAGTSGHDFTVPTGTARNLGVRVVVDPTAASPDGYQSAGWAFTVTAPPVPAPEPQPSTVALAATPSASIPLGGRVVVRGVATGAGRPTLLERRTATGWLTVGRGVTDPAGAYSFVLPTGWYYRGQLRVSLPATAAYLPAATAAFTTSVVPRYDPQGARSDWHLTTAGLRWDPCAGPISYRVNAAGVPARRLRQLRQALKLVHQATGLQFTYAGTTSAVPYRTDAGATRSEADLTIAFAGARTVRSFGTNVVGLGGFSWRGNAIVAGLVSLDRDARLADGFGRGPTWGSLMMHEVGHALGLAHAGGRQQVMHSGLNSRSHGSWQAGDLTGLRVQGAQDGCVVQPAARVSTRLHTVVSP